MIPLLISGANGPREKELGLYNGHSKSYGRSRSPARHSHRNKHRSSSRHRRHKRYLFQIQSDGIVSN
jgi:hypothetical protein